MGLKVLVVDNHPVILKYMRDLLEKEGHEVRVAQDGLSALSVLESCRPDVMFIDLVMPNIGGEKLCRIIRRLPHLRDSFIVILSAIASEDKADVSLFGADACIAKGPFDKMKEHVLSLLEQAKRGGHLDSPGRIYGLEYVYQREITKELLVTQRHFEIILSNVNEGILELTNDWKIIFANRIAISLTGIPEEKLLGSRLTELFEEPHRKRIRDLLEGMRNTPQSIDEDSPVLINNSLVLLTLLPVEERQVNSIVVILNDITERKRIEAQLQHVQKMEAIATLAGGIAHEFNNALFGIMGNLYLLQMDTPKNARAVKYLGKMKLSAERISNLTNQLLAYARGGKYHPEIISLNDFVTRTLPLITHTVDPPVRVETDLASDICTVEVDLTQLQMVLSALVANAAEAIEGEGYVRIMTRRKRLDGEFTKQHPEASPEPYVCLIVEDNGRGMDKETMSRVFEPFFTTKFQGRGLGMAAVYGIIRNHDGFISIDSEVKKGTVVKVYLPAVHRRVQEVEEPQKALLRGTGTILVVEDEETVMEVCKAMLERLGYEVLEARTGAEAVQAAKSHPKRIDLVILDIVLPDMGGKQVYPLLMGFRPEMKVIVCSGYDLDGPAQEILDAGAEGFLKKPYALSALSTMLNTVLG